MKTYRVELTEKALDDAGEAYLWIREQSEQAAFTWYEELLSVFRSLQKQPLRRPLAPETVFFEEQIRQLLYGKYRILFTLEAETVFVLRVRHGARGHLKPSDKQ
jgi:plasmid stabilization system protein ParE